MNRTVCAVLAAAVALAGAAADARPLKLKAASEEPQNQGLGVEYAFPKDVKSLRDAYIALGVGAEPGAPLDAGLDYLSSDADTQALTSGQDTKVAARITGYIRFDAPGIYTLETYSNDGVELTIGGQEIAKVDEKRGCDPVGAVEVNVREAGWYPLEALYWQRKGGSCLILEWAAEGSELEVVPAEMFGH